MVAGEEEERDARTHRSKRWKCTTECNLPTAMETQCLCLLKHLQKPVQTRRKGIDECSEHGHYTCPLNADHKMLYHKLAWHPVPW